MLAHSKGHITHHISHASQSSTTQRRKHFLLPYGFLMSSTRAETSDPSQHHRRRPHRPHLRTATGDNHLTTGLTPLNLTLPSAYGPDALPDDDSIYSPTTPVRVHMVHDQEHDDKHAVAISIDALPTPTPTSPPVSPTSPPPTEDPQTTEQSAMPRAPPPAYGLWRCSVRADPNLLHWRRVDELAGRSPRRFSSSPVLPPISPVSPAPATPTRLRASFVPVPVPVPVAEEVRDGSSTGPPEYETLSNIHLTSHLSTAPTEPVETQTEVNESAAVRHISQLLVSPSLTHHAFTQPQSQEEEEERGEMQETPSSAGLLVPVLFYPGPEVNLASTLSVAHAPQDDGGEEGDVQALTRAILRGGGH